MLDTKTKNRFVEMRAAGASYSKIIKELHISKDSCCKLSKEMAAEIDEAKRGELSALLESFGMVRESRIKTLGRLLEKIDAALAERDFSDVPADKLLAVRLKYVDALKDEIIPERKPLKTATPQGILKAYRDLFNDMVQGNVTGDRAQNESGLLSSMLKAIETTDLKTRLDELEKLLSVGR